jgi:hypothetical protein
LKTFLDNLKKVTGANASPPELTTQKSEKPIKEEKPVIKQGTN